MTSPTDTILDVVHRFFPKVKQLIRISNITNIEAAWFKVLFLLEWKEAEIWAENYFWLFHIRLCHLCILMWRHFLYWKNYRLDDKCKILLSTFNFSGTSLTMSTLSWLNLDSLDGGTKVFAPVKMMLFWVDVTEKNCSRCILAQKVFLILACLQ